jgi:hypothetical protein
VRFRRARGARTNAVRLHSSDGIDRMVAAPKGRVVFRQVHRGTHLRVTVRGVSAAGRMGAPSVASKR